MWKILRALIRGGIYNNIRNDAVCGPEVQESNYILINTSLRTAKRDIKIWLWHGFATKNISYVTTKLDNRLCKNVQDIQ